MSAAAEMMSEEDVLRICAALDNAALSRGFPAYSMLLADNALHRIGFQDAVRERAVGLANAENRRLRIALTLVLQDARTLQAHLARGETSEALAHLTGMLPELRAHAHKLKPAELPADVASLESARERRGGAR